MYCDSIFQHIVSIGGIVRSLRICMNYLYTRAGTNTPSDEYDTYRDTGWRIRYVSRIHFFSEAKLGNG